MKFRVVAKFIAMGAMCIMALGYVVSETRMGDSKSESKSLYSKSDSRQSNMSLPSAAKTAKRSATVISFGDDVDDNDAQDEISLMGANGAYSYTRIGLAYE